MTTRMTAADGWALIHPAHKARTGNGLADKPLNDMVTSLMDALHVLEDLQSGGNWQDHYPQLTGEDPHEDALELAEQDVADAGRDLKRLLDGMSTTIRKVAA